MLFIVMHKVDEVMEAGGRPNPELVGRMGALMQETARSGKLHNGAGLKRSAERVRLRCKGGRCERTNGPLRGENELVSGFAMLEVATLEDALRWSTRIADIVGEIEIDVGPVTEPWDIGVAPKPSGVVPLHALAVFKGDARTEAGQPLPAAAKKQLDALYGEMRSSGVLLAAEELMPSARGARLRVKGGKHTWVDGPFSESKEMIAGFVILHADSIDEVKAFTTRYADILGDVEVDVREVRVG